MKNEALFCGLEALAVGTMPQSTADARMSSASSKGIHR
jgi:hypothetical protein